MTNVEELKRIASQVRRDIVRMVAGAQSGHPGGSLSSTDILTDLYFNEMKINPSDWKRDGKNEDIFILSEGHITPVYYSILARRGYFPVAELATFRQFGSRLGPSFSRKRTSWHYPGFRFFGTGTFCSSRCGSRKET